MKSLQQYIIESIETDVNEGKIWDAIKKWFSDLFSPSDKKFDRYNNDNTFDNNEYVYYLEDHYNPNNIKMHKLSADALNNIVLDDEIHTNKKNDDGFWEFSDELKNTSDYTYYALIYEDKNCKDTCCLIKLNEETQLYNNCAEILKIQILKEFQKHISFYEVIDRLEVLLYDTHNGIFIKKDKNKKIYDMTINDCDFIKTMYNFNKSGSTSIAYKKFRVE